MVGDETAITDVLNRLRRAQGQLAGGQAHLVGDLTPGSAQAISAVAGDAAPEADEMLDRAAMESGAD